LADDVSKRVGQLHILVNNAGGLFSQRRETAEGFEATLALNFIGPFALTTRLLPLLSQTASSRVVNVVSSAFAMWKGDPFEDLDSRKRYVGFEALARAKLLNVLFTLALARRLDSTSTIVHAVNPGMAWTPGTAALTPAAVPQWRFVWPIVRWFQRRASAEAAAGAPVFVATSPAAGSPSGRYFDGLKEKGLPRSVCDITAQERAWNLGERFVGRALGSGGPWIDPLER
jgi:NAD(P)-dependent dehydrogenase (short-subunit alcohol dehydrogenase family)